MAIVERSIAGKPQDGTTVGTGFCGKVHFERPAGGQPEERRFSEWARGWLNGTRTKTTEPRKV